jgi:membrane protein DedA with SNARE-associated domain
MEQLLSLNLMHWIDLYGLWMVAIVIGLESTGIPLPGETVLISAAVLAGTQTGELSLVSIIAAAAAGAVVGDSTGYWIGHRFGLSVLLRHGSRIGLDEARLKLGQYLFIEHGGKIVFFGRFVPVLRVSAALLAGVNRMPWIRFLAFNASGAIAWATLVASVAYALGNSAHKLNGAFSTVLIALGLFVVFAGIVIIQRNEKRLLAEAEEALPGALSTNRSRLHQV